MDKVAELERRLRKRSELNSSLVEKNTDLNRRLSARADKLRRLDAYYVEQCQQLTADLNEAIKEIEELNAQLEKTRGDLEDTKRRFEKKRQAFSDLRMQSDSFRNSLTSTRDENVELRRSAEESERRRVKAVGQVRDLKHQLRMANKRVLLYRSRYEEIRKQYIRDVGKEPEESTDGKRSEE